MIYSTRRTLHSSRAHQAPHSQASNHRMQKSINNDFIHPSALSQRLTQSQSPLGPVHSSTPPLWHDLSQSSNQHPSPETPPELSIQPKHLFYLIRSQSPSPKAFHQINSPAPQKEAINSRSLVKISSLCTPPHLTVPCKTTHPHRSCYQTNNRRR